MYERIYRLLQPKLDPERRVHILRSSEDSGLANFLSAVNSSGSTGMDVDGKIYVQIDDLRNENKATWLEEFAHALQFLKYGNVELSVDDAERDEREKEVAECLLSRKLSAKEIEEIQHALKRYGGVHE